MIPESTNPDRDYPQMAAERGRIEPAPRRVRGYFDDTLIFDSTLARYVWEVAYYPQYYIPLSDIRRSICSTRTIHKGCSSAPHACIR